MQIAPQAEMRVGRVVETIARAMAYLGGAILIALALMTLVSIIGRWINAYGIRSIQGDYELVEAGCAIAVFAFLPWCQLNRGHVRVDLFTNGLPARGRAFTAWAGDVLIAGVAFMIMWRLYLGFGEKWPYFSEPLRDALSMGYKPFFAETTYELEIPIWIPFGLSLIGAVLFFVVSAYTVWRGWNQMARGDASGEAA